MSNGSLDQWLHPIEDEQQQCKRLSFIQRLNIAMDVAYALEYLHLHCQTPIVHCDVKPSNVLLNEDMTCQLAKGSIGYIPPEYGMGGQVSILGDIYSYGISCWRCSPGKRPTDDIDEEDADDETNKDDIEESAIIKEVDHHFNARSRVKDCLVSVLQIGLLCSATSPHQRMPTEIVVNKLSAIRDTFLDLRRGNTRKMS
ncbi:hypothetical protein SLA2020_272840 [Shorea laevis]